MAEHGGKRDGAGRKSVTEEAKARQLTISAIIKEFGSEEAAFAFAAKQVKDNQKQSFNFFKLLIEYAYGKPKETIDLNNNIVQDFDLSNCTPQQLEALLSIHGGQKSNTTDSQD